MLIIQKNNNLNVYENCKQKQFKNVFVILNHYYFHKKKVNFNFFYWTDNLKWYF